MLPPRRAPTAGRGVSPAHWATRRPGLRPLPPRRRRCRLRVRRRRAAPGAGMNTARPVLMFRLWYHGGIGAVRSLGRLGVPVHAVHDDARVPAARSRYLREVLQWDFDRTPSAESVEFLLESRAADGRFSGTARRRRPGARGSCPSTPMPRRGVHLPAPARRAQSPAVQQAWAA